MSLEDLGLNEWHQERLKESPQSEYSLARVVSVHKENYTLRNEDTEIPAEVTGKLLYGAASNLDLPVVGDWVEVEYFNDHTLAIIHSILPRKTLLRRKVAGKKIEYQAIASNIDTAFIVQSSEFDFNLRRLERYLIMVNDSHIEPVILLSKLDLVSPEELDREISEIKSINPGYKMTGFSNETGEGLDDIQKILKRGQTYCLLGSSGVGKTTLINRLIGRNVYSTSAVREKDGRGRHVTARRQLIFLEQGGMIVDTPGMRELGTIGVEIGLSETFADIVQFSRNCHFNNCTHTDEPGCSVTEAVRKGELPAKRYQNYLKIRKESKYHEMSYLDKRKKDKAFGKMIKTAMKDQKKQ